VRQPLPRPWHPFWSAYCAVSFGLDEPVLAGSAAAVLLGGVLAVAWILLCRCIERALAARPPGQIANAEAVESHEPDDEQPRCRRPPHFAQASVFETGAPPRVKLE
jgi:hypothetical protein